MQVPQVTEKVALAVVEFYPTILSLARAYSMLVSLLFLLISVLYPLNLQGSAALASSWEQISVACSIAVGVQVLSYYALTFL
jgi:hypothetical protein